MRGRPELGEGGGPRRTRGRARVGRGGGTYLGARGTEREDPKRSSETNDEPKIQNDYEHYVDKLSK